MKNLTLVRHAKSSWSDGSLSDHDRPLNRRGLRDAPFMGQRLAELACHPDQVLCSTAVRARETADLLLPPLQLPESAIAHTGSIYEASVAALITCVSEANPDSQHVMMIGHNPGFENLCETLVSGSVDRMATCAVASFELELKEWSYIHSLIESGTGVKLLFHDTPKNHL